MDGNRFRCVSKSATSESDSAKRVTHRAFSASINIGLRRPERSYALAMKPCRECKKEISSDANPCPFCGKKKPHGSSKVVLFGGGFLVLVWLVWLIGGGAQKQVEEQTAATMGQIEQKVATDAVAQYDIAKRNGDPIQTCVQAGMVSAAFLQAKDETNFNQWKATEKADCAKAGMPK
jgi:hypothetical protein